MKNLINKVNNNKKMIVAVGAGILGVGITLSTLLRGKKRAVFDVEDDISDEYFLSDDDDFNEEDKNLYDDIESEFEFCHYDPDEDLKKYLEMSEEEKNEEFRHTITMTLDVVFKEMLLTREDIEKLCKMINERYYSLNEGNELITSMCETIKEIDGILNRWNAKE